MASTKQLGGLKAKTIRAGVWTLSGQFVETLIRLGTNLLMTRLLVPADFGLMAVVITIPTSLVMLSDIGIRSNIIGKTNTPSSEYLRTAWTIQALRGAFLWGLVLLLAILLSFPFIKHLLPSDTVLSRPELPALLAATGSTLVLSGLGSVNIFVQERQIQMGPLMLLSLFSKILPVPIMIIWAYLYPSAWSLVAGSIAAQATLTLSSHILIPGATMKFFWNKTDARELLSNGTWTALSTASTFLVSQCDRLILAVLLTAAEMGQYAIAWTLVEVMRSVLLRIHGQITLPVLSELFRTRPETAIDAYYRYRRPIDAVTFAAVGFFWIAGPEIVNFLYDSRYSGAGWMFQVLVLSLATIPFFMINLAFIANNEWYNYFINMSFLAGCFLLSLAVGYALSGWTGTIWALALFSWPATILLLTRAYKRGWVDPIREIIMLPCALMGAVFGYGAKWILPQIGGWI